MAAPLLLRLSVVLPSAGATLCTPARAGALVRRLEAGLGKKSGDGRCCGHCLAAGSFFAGMGAHKAWSQLNYLLEPGLERIGRGLPAAWRG